MQIGKKTGKIAALSGVCPGFIGNRILAARTRQAQAMLLEGAMPWDIDKVLYDFGLPMGPFAMSDLAGLDIGWFKETSKSSTVREVLCEMDRRGQKTGAGYYDYDEKRNARPSPVTEKIVRDFMAKAGNKPREITEQEILERCVYAMINEGAKILEEKIAIRASDIDIVWINGYGFPVYRGGPMCYADTVGLKTVVEKLKEYGPRLGSDFTMSPLLERLAAGGRARAPAGARAASASPPRRDRGMDLQQPLRLLQVQPLHHLPVELDHSLAGVLRAREGLGDAARLGQGLGGGREDPVGGLHLRRVDQRLAVEAHLHRLPGLGVEPVAVGEVVPDAVEHADAVAPGRQHHVHQPGDQVAALLARVDPGLLGDVVGADHQAVQARAQRTAGGDDRVEARQGVDGLHHGPGEQRSGHAVRRQPPCKRVQVLGTRDLGQQHRVRPAAGHRFEILLEVVGVDRVDPDHRLAMPEAPGGEGLDELRAGLRLRLRRHRVLEVEDHRIHVEAARLVDCPLVDRRDVHRRAAGPSLVHFLFSRSVRCLQG
jgi:3-hydroxyacyl-CoA dehydrogenase